VFDELTSFPVFKRNWMRNTFNREPCDICGCIWHKIKCLITNNYWKLPMTRIAHTLTLAVSLLCLLALGACSGESTDTAGSQIADMAQETVATETVAPDPQVAAASEPPDAIARVGDQLITFSEINTMISSSPIVGLSLPELGSPDRDTVRLTLLDKMISANLLYLDALQKGADQDPDYQQTIQSFADSILASLYRSKYLVGDIEVSDQDIEDFYKKNIIEGTELSDDLRTGIEATIRKSRLKKRNATLRERLRKGHKVEIIATELDPEDDQVRSEGDVVATLDGVPITWGRVKPAMRRAHTLRSTQERIAVLEKIVDAHIMSKDAREVGLEQDPVFKMRLAEFSKTSLINLHRRSLLNSWEPSDEAIDAYYAVNQDKIIVKEMRKVQMLVVGTREQAEAVKKKIESNEINFNRAVIDYSIIPDAKKTLGETGWVAEGSGFTELDEVTFLLEAGEIGGPVQSPVGWHLVKVLDQRDALHKNVVDQQTRKVIRRMILDDKLDQYVINLRRESFAVVVNAEVINELSQQEIDWYQEILEKAQKSPEKVSEQIESLRKE